jgi:hypothetical protein
MLTIQNNDTLTLWGGNKKVFQKKSPFTLSNVQFSTNGDYYFLVSIQKVIIITPTFK